MDKPLVATEPNSKSDADAIAKPMANEHGKARKSNPVAKQKTRRGGIKHKREQEHFHYLAITQLGLSQKRTAWRPL